MPSATRTIGDCSDRRVRKVDAVTGRISPYVGTGNWGFSEDGEFAHSVAVQSCFLAVGQSDHLYVAEGSRVVRRIDTTGAITTVAGTDAYGYAGDGGQATEAQLDSVTGVAADAAGNLYVADFGNHRVRKIDAAGIITTFAGVGWPFNRGRWRLGDVGAILQSQGSGGGHGGQHLCN